MELASAVLTYYFTHASRLTAGKRFHLANRVATWNQDPRALSLLDSCRGEFVPQPLNAETLAASFAHVNREAHTEAPKIVAYEKRKPFFEMYPTLMGIEAELFRLRHLHLLFGIDAREVFLQRHPLPELRQLEEALVANEPALRALSTWAVNFIYLLHLEVLQDDHLDRAAWLRLGEGYNTADEEELRLLIYLYTHCIIAESNFYARQLPPEALPIYRGMLDRLESLLDGRLNQTSIDTKLEFLVCCRLTDRKTPLEPAIYDECARSLSPEGTFIVDTYNVFAGNLHKKTFEASEHRNILFALSALPRHPR